MGKITFASSSSSERDFTRVIVKDTEPYEQTLTRGGGEGGGERERGRGRGREGGIENAYAGVCVCVKEICSNEVSCFTESASCE
jgi:hypothetical protein